MMLHFIENNGRMVISIERSDNTEQYCLDLSDEKEDCLFLTEKYYKQSFVKKHEKGLFEYKDSFSKTFVQRDVQLMQINLFKLIPSSKTVSTDETYTRVKHNEELKRLFAKYEL